MAFGLGSLLSLAAPVITETFFGGDKGGGGGGADQTGAALIQAIQAGQKQSLLQERPLEEIEPAESAKERGEYLMRMLQAIQNNETEGRSAMDSVAASLMADMRNTTGGRIPEGFAIQPQQPAVQKVEAVELEELEEKEEPFVRQRSSYA